MDLKKEHSIGDDYLCEYWTGCPLGSRVRYKLPDGTAQRLCYPHSDMRKKEVAEDRLYMGICDCFQPLAEGKGSCQACLDEAREGEAERRAQRSEPGICSACGTSVLEDQEWCPQCSSGPPHQDSGEAKVRESTAGVSRKPSSDGKARGCSSKHLCGLTAWNT